MPKKMPFDYYKSQIEKNIDVLTKLNKKLKRNYLSRGIVFLVGTIVSILLFKIDIPEIVAYFAIFLTLIALIILAKQTQKIKKEIFYNEIKKTNNENELKALDFDFSAFDNGKKYIDPKHDFSFDLDIFGDNSIFQMLCRANTARGKLNFSNLLKNPFKNIKKITEYQHSIAEIRKKTDFLQEFKAKSKLLSIEESKIDSKKIDSSELIQTNFLSKFWGIILIIVPLLSIVLISFVSIGLLSFNYLLFFSMILFALTGIYLKYINKVHSFVTKQYKFFASYSDILNYIEQQNFESSYLKELQEKLKTNQKTASEILQKYSKLLNALDSRLNILFIIIADGLFLWDIQIIRRIEQHTQKFMTDYEKWFDLISEMETLVSLSVFSFNNPSYVFADAIADKVLIAKALGHPLINPKKRITNDFEVINNKKTLIVTGANMAGKSTFLRTIGVNQLLAQIGSVVCAEEFETSLFQIITSIRITDSLASDESYFYAELLRLQKIIQMLEKDDLLIIIDEMLRGTNSLDKHKGSEGLLKKLNLSSSISILATHDVDLAKLEKEFPDNVKNYCFEAQIINDELFFDYKLRDGVSKNLNASFLMKKMRIID